MHMPAAQIVTSFADGGWDRHGPARPLAGLAPAGCGTFGVAQLGALTVWSGRYGTAGFQAAAPRTGGRAAGRRAAGRFRTARPQVAGFWTAGPGAPGAGTAGFRTAARGAGRLVPNGPGAGPAGRETGRRWTGRREASERLTPLRGSNGRGAPGRGASGPPSLAQAGRARGARPQREAGAFGQPPLPLTGGRPGDSALGPAFLRTLFEEAAAGLTRGEREVIELQLRQGLAPGEVADVLGVSRGRADRLQAKARDQLETSLGVLLVARAGRGACEKLRSLLTGGDGQLTAALREQAGRHIDRCATCTATRATELRPGRLPDLPPGAILAAGAAESLRLAPGAPAGLRARTMSLAAGRGPVAAAGRAAVLARAGTFSAGGFPRPAGPASAGLAGPALAGPRGLAALRTALRTSRPGRVAVAGVAVLAVATAALAVTPGPAATPRPAAGPGRPAAGQPSGPARTRGGRPAITHPGPASMVSPGGAAPAAWTSWPRSPGGRPAGDPLTETHQPLRSWIEQNRLR